MNVELSHHYNTYRILYTKIDEKGSPIHFAIIEAHNAMDAVTQLRYNIVDVIMISNVAPVKEIISYGGKFACIYPGRMIIDGEEVKHGS